MYDPFEPRHEPARNLYLAFQDEATKRKGRSGEEWVLAERTRVFEEAQRQAALRGWRAPTLEDVAKAERSAMGHVDYGAKWALRLVELMSAQ